LKVNLMTVTCTVLVFCINSNRSIQGNWVHGKYVKPQGEEVKEEDIIEGVNIDGSRDDYRIKVSEPDNEKKDKVMNDEDDSSPNEEESI
jgi:hypothetical protein